MVRVEPILIVSKTWPERIRSTAFQNLSLFISFSSHRGVHCTDGQDAMTSQRPHS
jgi:hypothetical protein